MVENIYWIVKLTFCALLLIAFANSEFSGCPPQEDVFPCKCFNSPTTVLHCTNINDSEELKRVFARSAGYRYREVILEQSSLQYLPFDTFKRVRVLSLNLINVTLVQLFDEVPEDLDFLDTLHIENTDVFNGMTWELLKPLTFLRIVNIYYNIVPVLDKEFSDHISHNLEQLSLYATHTTDLEPGVFHKLKKLDKVAVDACELTKLSRDIFPVPSNVRFLYFNNNKIRVLSKDFFRDMPRLHSVGLKNNRIAAFQATDFTGTSTKLAYLFLEGNPLICDCRLKWFVENKPEVTSGKCDNPDELRRKPIGELTVPELRCRS